MKAVVIHHYGNNEALDHTELDKPMPQVGELLIKVHCAGINPVDWKIRNGLGERLGLQLPIVLGGEIAGTVEAIGEAVMGFAIGDAVYGLIRCGGFAGYAIARTGDVVSKPASIGFEQAAAIPLGGLTAWQALFDLAKLGSGQRVLITGASGGVGSLAVQLAKAKGAHVIATASGRNAGFVESLGADEFVDYTTQAFETIVKEVDVVFDTVGGETYEKAFVTVKPGGILVTSVAFPTEAQMAHRRVRAARVYCKPNAEQLTAISMLVEAGKLRAHVASVLPLADVGQAFALSETGRTRGKIVLKIDD